MDGWLKGTIIGGFAVIAIGGISVFGGASLVNISLFGDSDNDKSEMSVSSDKEYTDTYMESSDIYSDTYSEYDSSVSLETDGFSGIDSIIDNKIKGSFIREGQIYEYKYTATVSGRYRFDFDINDVNYNYSFAIYDSKDEKLEYENSNNGGVTVTLEENTSYKICIEQEYGLCDFEITIGQPSAIKDVVGSSFGGKISYVSQQDFYIFKTTNEGNYRFDFNINDINNSYMFAIYDSKNERLSYEYSRNDGVTVKLNKDSQYKISIEQDNGVCDYSIDIGIPLPVQNISGSTFKGDITYTGQENFYRFTSKNQGHYRFDFNIDDVNNKYKFSIFDEKNANLANEYSYNDGVTVVLNKNSTYTICIEQIKGISKYEINIGMPKDIVDLNKNNFSSSITYKNQNDIYTYTATHTGEHKFELNIDDINNNYLITVYDNKNQKINWGYSYNKNMLAELVAGKVYKIYIEQNRGMCNYNVNIIPQ